MNETRGSKNTPFCLVGGKKQQNQRFNQYVDAETCVVKRPEGEGYDDPYGDGVWRTSWFFSSLLVIQAKEPTTANRLNEEHGVQIGQVETFLRYFHVNCTNENEWNLPKNASQRFSGDQLAPFLYLLASVNAFGTDEAKSLGKQLLAKLIELDKRKGALSDSPQGKILDNQRFAIDVVCRMYDVDYLKGIRRDLCQGAFTLAVKGNNALAQLPWEQLATLDDFSVFNALGIVSATCIKWSATQKDVKMWRESYALHADKGWGPAFRIVSGRSFDGSAIDDYYDAHIKRDEDNDIIMAQRPHKYLKGDFNPNQKGGPGQWLVLDYVILKGLQLLWQ